MSAKAQRNRTGARLFKTVLVIFGQSTTQSVDDHNDYGRRQDTSYDDQQKFHGFTLASAQADTTSAGIGGPISAEKVTDRPNARWIFAHVPVVRNALSSPNTEARPC